MFTAAQNLPASIAWVVSDPQNGGSLQNVAAADGSHILWIRKSPTIAAKIVIVSAHVIPISNGSILIAIRR